jgi:hypothetical protein
LLTVIKGRDARAAPDQTMKLKRSTHTIEPDLIVRLLNI